MAWLECMNERSGHMQIVKRLAGLIMESSIFAGALQCIDAKLFRALL